MILAQICAALCCLILFTRLLPDKESPTTNPTKPPSTVTPAPSGDSPLYPGPGSHDNAHANSPGEANPDDSLHQHLPPIVHPEHGSTTTAPLKPVVPPGVHDQPTTARPTTTKFPGSQFVPQHVGKPLHKRT